jgi:hypothetical protein
MLHVVKSILNNKTYFDDFLLYPLGLYPKPHRSLHWPVIRILYVSISQVSLRNRWTSKQANKQTNKTNKSVFKKCVFNFRWFDTYIDLGTKITKRPINKHYGWNTIQAKFTPTESVLIYITCDFRFNIKDFDRLLKALRLQDDRLTHITDDTQFKLKATPKSPNILF